MKCDATLELMLEADLEALAGRGRSPVAMHVRECGRCRSIAAQLLADTRVLAAAITTREAELLGEPWAGAGAGSKAMRQPPRARRGKYLMIGSLAAAAALALVVVRRGADERLRSSEVVRRAVTEPIRVAATPPTRVSVADRAASRSAVTPEDEPSSPSFARGASQPFPRAQPVSAKRFAVRSAQSETAVDEHRGVVSVTPPPGTRVAVMQTRDPGVTVVWLY
jgi:hypothetical protein